MKQEKSLTNRIIKGSLIVVIFTSFISPLSYLVKMIYSRSLSIEMFGLFYAILSFFNLITSFTDFGFGYCLTYLVPKYYKIKDYKTCWKLYKYNQIISFIISCLLAIIIALFANWLSKYYFRVTEARQIIYVFTIILISGSILNTTTNFFIGLQQEKYYSSIQSIKILLALSFSAVIWLSKNSNILFFSIAWMISTIIVAILMHTLLKRKFRYMATGIVWDIKLLKLMSRYALPNFLTIFIISFTGSFGTIALTLLKGVSEVGMYEIIIPLATLSGIILTPINNFILPLISHFEDEKEKLIKLIESALKIMPFIGFYFALFIVLFPSQPIHILFGEKWIDLTKTPLIILAAGYVIAQVANLLATIVVGIGKINERLKASMVTALISTVLTYIFVKQYSVLGLTISLTILYIITTYINTIIIKKSYFFKFPVNLYKKLLALGVIMYLFVDFTNIQPNNLIQYLLYGFIYTIIMGLLALWLKLFDKNMLESFLKR